MHATPPMGPLNVVKNSLLSDDLGWLNVNPQTLQHKTYGKLYI